jgi:hypothetical protein
VRSAVAGSRGATPSATPLSPAQNLLAGARYIRWSTVSSPGRHLASGRRVHAEVRKGGVSRVGADGDPGFAARNPSGSTPVRSSMVSGSATVFADYTSTGASSLGTVEGNLGSYLLGYTILLNETAISPQASRRPTSRTSSSSTTASSNCSRIPSSVTCSISFLPRPRQAQRSTVRARVSASSPAAPRCRPASPTWAALVTAPPPSDLALRQLGRWRGGGLDLLTIHTALPVVDENRQACRSPVR